MMASVRPPLNVIALVARQQPNIRIRFLLTSWNSKHNNRSSNINNTNASTLLVVDKDSPSRPYLHSQSLMLMTTPQAASSDSSPSPPIKTVRVVIKGRVQGVFYRNWTVENATPLGLNGWVRNRRDSSVEAVFSGKADAVQEMEQRCRRGPPDAMVTGLQVFPCDEAPGTGFERRPTV